MICLGQLQQIESAYDSCSYRINGIFLIMDRGSRACKIENDRNIIIRHRHCHVMVHKREVRIIQKMLDVLHISSIKIVYTQNTILFFDKSIAQVGTDKTGSTCNNSFLRVFCLLHCSISNVPKYSFSLTNTTMVYVPSGSGLNDVEYSPSSLKLQESDVSISPSSLYIIYETSSSLFPTIVISPL